MQDLKKQLSFWRWFFKGTGGHSGLYRLFDRWLFLHLFLSVSISLIPIDLKDAATRVLLPLIGLLVGLTLAWFGNAHALLQTREMKVLSEYHKGGFAEYVNLYQLSIFILLATIVIWGFAGLEVYEKIVPPETFPFWYFIIKIFSYLFISMSIREAWSAVNGARLMLLAQKEIQDRVEKAEKS